MPVQQINDRAGREMARLIREVGLNDPVGLVDAVCVAIQVGQTMTKFHAVALAVDCAIPDVLPLCIPAAIQPRAMGSPQFLAQFTLTGIIKNGTGHD